MKKISNFIKFSFYFFLLCALKAYALDNASSLSASAGAMVENKHLTTKRINSIINEIGNDVYAAPIDFVLIDTYDYDDTGTHNEFIDQFISSRDKISIPVLTSHANTRRNKEANPIKLIVRYSLAPYNENYPGMYIHLIDVISKLGDINGIILVDREGFRFEGDDAVGGSSTQAALGLAVCKTLLYGTKKERNIIKYNFGDDIVCSDNVTYSKNDEGAGITYRESKYGHVYDKFAAKPGHSGYNSINADFLENIPNYHDVDGFYQSIGWLVKMFGVSNSDFSKRTVQYGWNIDGNSVNKLNTHYVYTEKPNAGYASYVPDFVYYTIENDQKPYSFEKNINALKIQPGSNVETILINMEPKYYKGLMQSSNMFSRLSNDKVVGIAYKNLWPEDICKTSIEDPWPECTHINYKGYKSPWAAYGELWGL